MNAHPVTPEIILPRDVAAPYSLVDVSRQAFVFDDLVWPVFIEADTCRQFDLLRRSECGEQKRLTHLLRMLDIHVCLNPGREFFMFGAMVPSSTRFAVLLTHDDKRGMRYVVRAITTEFAVQ